MILLSFVVMMNLLLLALALWMWRKLRSEVVVCIHRTGINTVDVEVYNDDRVTCLVGESLPINGSIYLDTGGDIKRDYNEYAVIK